MSKKFKGFSLAELLISLLIISIVLSAAIPTLTRRAGADREHIWRWSTENNSAYFGLGANQTAIIGSQVVPMKDESLATIISDTEAPLTNLKFSNNGDRLAILKKTIQNETSNMSNSHISFYTVPNSLTATTDDIQYAGRIASDPHSLAFGIGTLQSTAPASSELKNTALGHYVLMATTTGQENTGVGEKALSYNAVGTGNTSVGYKSAFSLGSSVDASGNAIASDYNTSVGWLALAGNQKGTSNTAVGAEALGYATIGDYNTAVGDSALVSLQSGDINTAIGHGACENLMSGQANVCIGSSAGTSYIAQHHGTNAVNDTLIIDSRRGNKTTNPEAPLIVGHFDNDTGYDKDLTINAKKVKFATHNGRHDLFEFTSYFGTNNNGYQIDGEDLTSNGNDNAGFGHAIFKLRDMERDPSAVLLSIAADYGKNPITEASYDKNATVLFHAYNHTDPNHGAGAAYNEPDILFNSKLLFDFPANMDNYSGASGFPISLRGSLIPTWAPNRPTNDIYYHVALNNKLDVGGHANTPEMHLSIDDTNGNGVFSLKASPLAVDNTFTIVPRGELILQELKALKFLNSDASAEAWVDVHVGGIALHNKEMAGKPMLFKYRAGTAGWDIEIPGLVKSMTTGGVTTSGSPSLVENISRLWQQVDQIINGTPNSPSDERLKDISGDSTAGLEQINAIQVKNYTYKADKQKTPHVGVIAQQLQKVFPNSVAEGEDGYLRIRTEEIFYAMVNSIKELFAKVQDLTAKVTGLDKRITELEAQNKMLLEQNKAFEKRLEKLEKQVK